MNVHLFIKCYFKNTKFQIHLFSIGVHFWNFHHEYFLPQFNHLMELILLFKQCCIVIKHNK